MSGPSTNFTWEEVTVRRGVPGADLPHLTDDVRAELRRVCACAQVIRAAVNQPVRVTSGFRHKDPNQHGAGQALDIQVDGMSPRELMALIRTLDMPHKLRQVIAESNHAERKSLGNKMSVGGGLWVHIAVRGVAGDWAKASKKPWQEAWGPNADKDYAVV